MSSLNRFIIMQEKYYKKVDEELKNEKKRSHWMWFMFPQIIGLSFSDMSIKYAIKDINEAIEYLNNDYLRNNLFNLFNILLLSKSNDIKTIMGDIDSIKLNSCLTLFFYIYKQYANMIRHENIEENTETIKSLLLKFYNGRCDKKTISILLYMQYYRREYII